MSFVRDTIIVPQTFKIILIITSNIIDASNTAIAVQLTRISSIGRNRIYATRNHRFQFFNKITFFRSIRQFVYHPAPILHKILHAQNVVNGKLTTFRKQTLRFFFDVQIIVDGRIRAPEFLTL